MRLAISMPEWFSQAKCFELCREGLASPDWWFPSAKARERWRHAAEACSVCPIQAECALWVRKHNMAATGAATRLYGVWGGQYHSPFSRRTRPAGDDDA